MGFSKSRATYLITLVVGAFWIAWTYYQRGQAEASLMNDATGIFSNLIFVGVLLMGFMVFMLSRTRRMI